MKTIVICFSQTGNTRKVAENICSGIIKNTGQCELANMQEVDVDSLSGYDLVGLGCPAFYFKEPFNVTDFIEGLPQLPNKHWFVFCSHGAVMGQTLFSMAERLRKKGIVVIGSHHTYADITVPYYPKHTLTSGHPDSQDLMEAFEFGKEIVNISKAVTNGDESRIVSPPSATEDWVNDEAGMFTPEGLAKIMPPLIINLETCTKCGECQESCPVDGIDVESDPPRIQNPCIYCFHCASICPTCSIDADWGPLVKMAPYNYARYTKALNDAKDRGEFRWLISPETVDCDFPLYIQRKHEIKGE